jgi:adenylate cyclase
MAIPRPAINIQNLTARHLTRLYVVSLTTIAGLAIGGQVVIQTQLFRQARDVEVVSTAQNRQQLCERLVKTTLAVKMAEADERSLALQELTQVMQDWEGSQEGLRLRMRQTLSNAEMAEVEPMLAKLKPLAQEIVMTAKTTLRWNELPVEPRMSRRDRLNGAMAEVSGLSQPVGQLSAVRLMKVGTEFNQGIDDLIRWYGKRANDGVGRLKLMEFGLLGLTLGTLLLEGLIVFRPAIDRLKETLQALERSLRNLSVEQEKSEALLLNILPGPIADRLKLRPNSIADSFAEATVLFADIVGFTELSSRLTPQELVKYLNEIFSCFDRLAEKHGVEKIKTIGDAYMVVGGLPNPRADHAIAIVKMALEMQTELQVLNRLMGENFNIRIGINSGPVVAGVIGIKKFIYDLWGDTVNIASRMESHGEPGAIHLSEATYRKLDGQFECQSRGKIQVKGKGEMITYWLKSANTVPLTVPMVR